MASRMRASKPRGKRKGWKLAGDDILVKDRENEYFVVTAAMRRRGIQVSRSEFAHSTYITYLDPITDIYWIEGG